MKMKTEFIYVNETSKFWKHSYKVWLSEFNYVIVNADYEQDALDFAIDYAESQNWNGLFLTEEERKEIENDGFLDDYVSGGNHGKYLSSLNVTIVQLD
jgi:hypothetical protein